MYAILRSDGRPVTVPAQLPAVSGKLFQLASSGKTFLIAWEEDGRIRAAVLALDGTMLNEPLTLSAPIASDEVSLTSVLWHAGRYLIAAGGQLYRVSAAGEIAPGEEAPVRVAWSSERIYLAHDGERLLAWVARVEGPICNCLPQIDLTLHELDGRTLEERWTMSETHTGALLWGPVFAAGGGHRLLLWADYVANNSAGDDGTVRSVVPDPQSGGFFSAAWTPDRFLVTSGKRMLVYDLNGAYREAVALPARTVQSTISANGAMLLMTRLLPDGAQVVVSARP